jgi:hypothetical protein
VFNTVKLEKVQGSCLPSSHAFSPFNDKNRYMMSSESEDDTFEEKNFISGNNPLFNNNKNDKNSKNNQGLS